jgi:hypothetical protein
LDGSVDPLGASVFFCRGGIEGTAMAGSTYQAYYQYELKKLIDTHIERIKESLTSSYQVEGFDFSSYKHIVGRIEGLRLALELCEEAESIINGNEQGD